MHETIGRRLKKAREHHDLTLDQAAEATRIRVNYLKALEADDYSIMPSAAQGRGFLRNYAAFLELNLDVELADIQKNPPEPSEISGPLPNADIIPEQTESPDELSSPPSWMDQLQSIQDRILPRRQNPNGESAPEAESPEASPPVINGQVHAEVVEAPKRRGRQKRVEKISHGSTGKEKRKRPKKESSPLVEEVSGQDRAEIILESEYLLTDEEPVEDEALSQSVEGDRLAEAEAKVQNETESPAIEAQQADESNPSLLQKVLSLFRIRRTKNDANLKKDDIKEVEVKEPEQPIVAVSASVSNETAEEIFMSIGKELQTRREMISLTFDEVERYIHVRAVFLKQMEEGAFDKLPSPVQTRGMLANYATFLDLDADTILLRYAEALQARHRQKYPERLRSTSPIQTTPSIPPLRSFIAGDVIFGVTMVVMLIALAIWGVGRVLTTQQLEKASLPTAPSISDVLAGTPIPTVPQEVTFVPVDDAPVATVEGATLEVPTLPANISVQVIVTTVERTFLRVSVDGKTAYDGRVAPGEEFTFEAENQVSILTGNAAALRVIYNGRDLGLMGNFGEVVSQIYTGAGLATPTATLPPTATPTPLVSPTATQTGTPTQTPSPTPELSTPTP